MIIGVETTAPPPPEPTEDDIRRLLDAFYDRVRADPLIGPVFLRALGTTAEDWAPHMARLNDYWSNVMLRTGRYRGNILHTHQRLPDLQPEMFDRWLALFGNTCAEMLDPALAENFRQRANHIGKNLRASLFGRVL